MQFCRTVWHKPAFPSKQTDVLESRNSGFGGSIKCAVVKAEIEKLPLPHFPPKQRFVHCLCAAAPSQPYDAVCNSFLDVFCAFVLCIRRSFYIHNNIHILAKYVWQPREWLGMEEHISGFVCCHVIVGPPDPPSEIGLASDFTMPLYAGDKPLPPADVGQCLEFMKALAPVARSLMLPPTH